MIVVYGDDRLEFKEMLQVKVSYVVKMFLELQGYDDELSDNDFSDLFPEIVFKTKKAECDQVLFDLDVWSRDLFVHTLSPLHEFALYKILEDSLEIERDNKNIDGIDTFFTDDDKKETFERERLSPEEQTNLFDIAYYLDVSFLDDDFIEVPFYVNNLDAENIEIVLNQLGFDLNRYYDLMPPDIEEKVRKYYYDLDKEKLARNLIYLVNSSIESFAHNITRKAAYRLLWDNDKSRNEIFVQDLFLTHISGRYHELEVDVSREVDTGRGKVDFKISKGKEKVLIEIKLAKNPKLEHGLEYQLVEYLLSEEVRNGIFLVVFYKDEELEKCFKLSEVVDRVNEKYDLAIMLRIIDARNDKKSASVTDVEPSRTI